MQFESLGLIGLFFASFLAATFLPFSSEAIFLYLQSEGISIYQIIAIATIGNGLGSILNYYIGRLGKLEWGEKYLKISNKDLSKVEKIVLKYGPCSAILCWLPIIGDPLALCLGMFKTEPKTTFCFIFNGKALRYIGLSLLF
jgi:membrane protein YqaA with SNARE-associated domain